MVRKQLGLDHSGAHVTVVRVIKRGAIFMVLCKNGVGSKFYVAPSDLVL